MGQHALAHPHNGVAQSLPVLGSSLGRGKDAGRQLILLLQPVSQRLGTIGGQHLVVLVGALRRGIAVYLNLAHADIGVCSHDVECIGNLAQLSAVVHVVGLHLPLVHHEGDIGRAVQVALLLRRGRHHVGQSHQVVRIGRKQGGQIGLLVLHQVATTAEVTLHIDVSGTVPGLVRHTIGIGILLCRTVLTTYIVTVVSIQRVYAVTLEDDILASATHDEGLHALLLRAVLALDDGGKGTVAVRGNVQLVQYEVHRNDGLVLCESHLNILDTNLVVGALLVASQTDGLLGRHHRTQ